jgi:NitT/TauT family transport system substrate-binding protein
LADDSGNSSVEGRKRVATNSYPTHRGPRQRYTRRDLIRRGAVGAGAVGSGLLGLSILGCGSGNSSKSAGSAAQKTAAAKPATKMTISYDGTPNDVPLFLARDQGIFAKHGIDASLIQIAGPTSVAAVLSGQVQAGHSGGSEVIGAAVQGGDVKIVAVQSPVFPFLFMVQPDIKTPADLKGKKVGVSQPGGAADTALRIVLPKLGLQPDKDVTFISLGSIANQVAGLKSGAIQGTIIVDGPDSLMMQKAGFPSLFDFAKLDVPYVDAVVEFKGSYIDANRALVQNYVDSMIEATLLFRSNKDASLQALAKIFQGTDTESYSAAYDYYSQPNVTVVPPTPKLEDFTNAIAILCKKEPKACNFDPSKMIDGSFVASAVSRGLAK